MSGSLWFVVPAFGRLEMAAACLRQLRRTCDLLTAEGLEAHAVVVADDENLDVARELEFATVERGNRPLGRKWNDGYELACHPKLDRWRQPAGWVVPFGTDDWVDPAFILDGPLPGAGEVRCARWSSIVREDGSRLARLTIPYAGGDGVRIFPASLFEPLNFRPAQEDAPRAIDTSVFRRLSRLPDGPPRVVYHDMHRLQLVDFKSPDGQLNPYAGCQHFRDGDELRDPWDALEPVYGREPVEDMQAVYGLVTA